MGSPACRTRPARNRAGREWASYHVFYHGPGDRLLSRLVLPVVRDLWNRGRIDRFFFIRYGLGGPHVRLRLLCAPGAGEEAGESLRQAAEGFFARWPAETLDDDEIRRQNRPFAASHSPAELDAVHPNHSVASVPFEPEVERYGGPDLIGSSLDFFCVSSAYALDLISRHEGEPRPRRLSHAMRALLRQALGFAAGGRELPAIAAYAAAGTGPGTSLLLARADQEFARSPEDYLALIQEEIEISRDSLLTAAAQVLESRLRGTADPAWWRVVGSQLHMTANRLDLMNVEELYLGQILRRALERAATPPAALPVSPGSGDNGLAALAASSLAWLAASTRDEDLAYAGIPERANDER